MLMVASEYVVRDVCMCNIEFFYLFHVSWRNFDEQKSFISVQKITRTENSTIDRSDSNSTSK